jgi:hypothetical protein
MQARPRPALLVLNVNAVSISAAYLDALSRPWARSLATDADLIAGQYAAQPGSYLASAVLNSAQSLAAWWRINETALRTYSSGR